MTISRRFRRFEMLVCTGPLTVAVNELGLGWKRRLAEAKANMGGTMRRHTQPKLE